MGSSDRPHSGLQLPAVAPSPGCHPSIPGLPKVCAQARFQSQYLHLLFSTPWVPATSFPEGTTLSQTCVPCTCCSFCTCSSRILSSVCASWGTELQKASQTRSLPLVHGPTATHHCPKCSADGHRRKRNPGGSR